MSYLPEFNSSSQGAIHMKQMGFFVFPLKPHSKEPAAKGWQAQALTFEEGTISSYVMGCGFEDANFGVALAERDVVIDLDPRDGNTVEKLLAALVEKFGPLPPTFTVKTPSGGYHLYFRCKGRHYRGKLMDNVDVKAHKGFVVAPGSRRKDDKQYEIVDASAVAELPAAYEDALAKVPAPVKTVAIDIPMDLPGNVRSAIDYLQNAEIAVEYVNGDVTLHGVFANLKDMGISAEKEEELFWDHFNDRCEPPWEDNEESREYVKKKITQGWKTKNAPGSNTPEARQASAEEDFDVLPDAPKTTPTKNEKPIAPLPLKSAGAIDEAAIPKRDWIISGFLLGGFLSLTGAPGGTGKSNFELRKAFAVVTGRNLLGERNPVIRKGPVVFYNCEDSLEEVERRVAALRIELGLTQEDLKDLYLISGRDHSLTVAHVDKHGEVVINEHATQRLILTLQNVGAVMLSVDPLVRTHALNENDNMAMDKVTQALQRISSGASCAVSAVHHTNKAALNTNNRKDDSASQAVFRGAGSLVASARIGHVLTTMNSDEAKRLSIPPERRRWYFKVESAKANLSAPAESADWYESREVEIPNGEKIGICRPVCLIDKDAAEKASADEAAKAFGTSQQQEGLAFLEKEVPPEGETIEVAKLNVRAKRAGESFAGKSNTRQFVDFLEDIPNLDQRFLITRDAKVGPKAPYLIQRVAKGAAPTDPVFN